MVENFSDGEAWIHKLPAGVSLIQPPWEKFINFYQSLVIAEIEHAWKCVFSNVIRGNVNKKPKTKLSVSQHCNIGDLIKKIMIA